MPLKNLKFGGRPELFESHVFFFQIGVRQFEGVLVSFVYANSCHKETRETFFAGIRPLLMKQKIKERKNFFYLIFLFVYDVIVKQFF
jgi:hypothetical protein